MNKISKFLRLPSGTIIEIDEEKLYSLSMNDIISQELYSSINTKIDDGKKTKEGDLMSLILSSGRVMQVIEFIIIKSQYTSGMSLIDLSDNDLTILITYILLAIKRQETILISNRKSITH